jgi:hypothetical protein
MRGMLAVCAFPAPRCKQVTHKLWQQGIFSCSRFGAARPHAKSRAPCYAYADKMSEAVMRFGVFHELQLPRPWNDDDEHVMFHEALAQVALADHGGRGTAALLRRE